MAVRSQFFDSINGDRIYDAEEFSQHLNKINSDGIIQDNDTDSLRVSPTSPASLAVEVGFGSAFIQGRFVEVFDSPEVLTIAENTSGMLRTDGIFAQLDFLNREVRFVVKTGDISFVRNSTVWELRLAQVQVADGATEIVGDDIFDDRADLFACGKSKPTTLRQNFQNITATAEWKTIAVNNGVFSGVERKQDAHAMFVVRSDEGVSVFGGLHFIASFNHNRPTITLLHRGISNGGDQIEGLRITYDINGNSAVQVLVTTTSVTRTFEIYDNYSMNGWFPVNWTSGTSLGTDVMLDLTDPNVVQGYATDDGSFSALRNGEIVNVTTPNNVFMTENNSFLQGVQTDGTTIRNLIGLNNFNNIVVGSTARQLVLLSLGLGPQFFDGAIFHDIFHAGYVQPQVRAFHNVSQSIPNAVATALLFNSERWDTDTMHDNVTNNSRLTANTDGLYQIDFSGEWDTNATGQRQFFLQVNGTTPIAVIRHDASGASTTQMNVSSQYQLSAGDFVEVFAFQNSGGALDVLANAQFSPEFSMSFISPI